MTFNPHNRRTGIANLPLHGGRAPRWLFSRMVRLAREISCVICSQVGHKEYLVKLSDPFWFQAFGCALGFDWHSSGLTTTVCGALKQGLKGLEKELNIYVCGGKGGTSRKTPQELTELGEQRLISVDPEKLIYASRMSAKVDNTALQDGYQIYQHSFICDGQGGWAVIQQGMNDATGWARRYHWLGDEVKDFVCEPQKAICCDHTGNALNMVALESEGARERSTEVARMKPDKAVDEFRKIETLTLSQHHYVSQKEIQPKNLHKILLSTYERGVDNFEALLGMPGVGPKTIRALALISELVYGDKPSFRDPARYSFAHGGKDGHPYPVNRRVYDTSIDFLHRAISKAKIGSTERIKAFKRLNTFYSS